VWKALHDGVTYEERGPEANKARAHRRATKMIANCEVSAIVWTSHGPDGEHLTELIFDRV
jgi:hypothetical protein